MYEKNDLHFFRCVLGWGKMTQKEPQPACAEGNKESFFCNGARMNDFRRGAHLDGRRTLLCVAHSYHESED
jgi:hypothetical protein